MCGRLVVRRQAMLWRDPSNESAARGLRQAEKGVTMLHQEEAAEWLGQVFTTFMKPCSQMTDMILRFYQLCLRCYDQMLTVAPNTPPASSRSATTRTHSSSRRAPLPLLSIRA
jgi:hypothetical protein